MSIENIKIVGRKIEVTKAISDYAKKRLSVLEKYLSNIVSIQVILEVDKYRHTAEIIVHTSGKVFKIKDEEKDLYVAIDKAAHRIKELVMKYKERIVSAKKHRKKASEIFVEEDPSIKEDAIYVEKLSAGDALKLFSEGEENFLVFVDKDTNKVCIIYNSSGKVKVSELVF